MRKVKQMDKPSKQKEWKEKWKRQEESVWKPFLILCALFLWILSLQKSSTWLWVGILAGMLFFWHRFARVSCLVLWFVLSYGYAGLISQPIQDAVPGIYRVGEIHTGYAIASSNAGSLIVYHPETLELEQQIDVNSVEEIHAMNNIGLFSFQNFAAEKGIVCSSEDWQSVSASPITLRRILWRWLNGRSDKDVWRFLAYGLCEDEGLEWVSSLGLPVLGLFQVVRTLLSRRLMKPWDKWIMTALQGVWMLCFPITPSLIRLFVFSLAGCLCSKWEYRWPLGIILFLLWKPGYGDEMCFLLPAGLSFLNHMQGRTARKKCLGALWCVSCQILFSSSMNPLMTFCFLYLRTAFGWLIVFLLPGLLFPDWSLLLYSWLSALPISLSGLSVSGMAPFWYAVWLCICFVRLSWHWKRSWFVFLIGSLCLYPWVWRLDPFFHVYQLDVGQGDAMVMITPFQKEVVMIDAAGRFNHDNASELFLPFFESRQIHQLDALLITHPDFDHNGSQESLLQSFPIKSLVLEEEDLPALDLDLQLLLEERAVDDDEEKNDQSLIAHISYDGFQYLWTGDASVHVEKQLLEQYKLNVDFLKLGHHGSKTSSDKAFLKETNPTLALISSGYRNRYGHPSIEVLRTLNELGIDRINTADHGMIHIFTLPGLGFVETADRLMTMIWTHEKTAA